MSIDLTPYLRQRLTDRERALRREVDAERLRPVREGEGAAEPRGDIGDEAAASTAKDMNLLETARDLSELSAIEEALLRIESGTYGMCDDCGATIDFERLKAQPTATFCIDCQHRRERTYARPRTPTL